MRDLVKQQAYIKAWRQRRREAKLALVVVEPDLLGEIWKPYPGFDGFFADYYEVSNKGRVRSLPRQVAFADPKRPGSWVMTQPGKILKPANHHGYLGVVLNKDGIKKQLTVGRMVAETFIPNPQNKAQVNHINGDKTDNRVENLEWNTPQENTAHGRRVLGRCVGILNGRAKLNPEKVREIRRLGETMSVKCIAALFEMSEGAIDPILKGEHWKQVI